MLLFLAVLGVSCGFASALVVDSACYGHNYKLSSKYFPTQSNDLVYFTPSHGGPKKLLIDKGLPVDPRIRIASDSFWFMSLTNRDEGTFGVSSDGNRLKDLLKLQIMDCTETITMFYTESLERDVPDTLLLDYVPQESLDEPITLWNHTALAFKSTVSSESTTIITYVSVSCSILAFGIFFCCCCRKCCKNDSSTANTEAASPTVYDHDPPPTVPTSSGPVYPSAHPQQPGYQPVNIYPPPPVTSVNSSQPGYMSANPFPPAINVSPPPPGYMNTNPFPPGINVSPPSSGVMNANPVPPAINVSPPQPGYMNTNPFPPGINVSPPSPGIMNPLPPGITTNPLQTEVAPPADQGPTSTPTFSSEFLSSNSEPRFELTGFNIPFSSPLSSNTPSSDVYNSDKLNFQ